MLVIHAVRATSQVAAKRERRRSLTKLVAQNHQNGKPAKLAGSMWPAGGYQPILGSWSWANWEVNNIRI